MVGCLLLPTVVWRTRNAPTHALQRGASQFSIQIASIASQDTWKALIRALQQLRLRRPKTFLGLRAKGALSRDGSRGYAVPVYPSLPALRSATDTSGSSCRPPVATVSDRWLHWAADARRGMAPVPAGMGWPRRHVLRATA